MTVTSERITLDPSEVSTGRTEFDITPWIDHEGIDWGDAGIAAFMSEADVGEVPVDFRTPNRQIVIPMGFVDRGTITGQEARAAVQRKVALFQREGGWLKRVTNRHGTIYADIVDGAFHASSVPGYASKQDIDLEASVTLNVIPEFYGNEIQLGDHVNTTANQLVFTESTIEGDIPGRVRMVIDNDQANSQESLIYGFRSRNYDSGTAAKLTWEVESFESLGITGSRVALAGASNGSAVKGTAGTTKRDIISEPALGHQGHYRVFTRAYSASAGTAQLWINLRFSVDGGNTFTVNDEVEVTPGSVFGIYDLGPVDIRKPPVGDSAWRLYLQARGAIGNEDIKFDQVWLCPADEYSGIVRDEAMFVSRPGNELRTEGYFGRPTFSYYEKPVWGDLPRMPVPTEPGGVVEVFLKASRGTIGDSIGLTASSDAGLNDDISARITYRPSWLFVDDT
jgi:hypothetical protein